MQTTIQADNCGCLMMFEYPCMYICSIYNRMNGSIQDPLQANRPCKKNVSRAAAKSELRSIINSSTRMR